MFSDTICFTSVSEARLRGKIRRINDALQADPVDIVTLKEMAISADGLISNDLRCKVWPKFLNVNVYDAPRTPGKKKGDFLPSFPFFLVFPFTFPFSTYFYFSSYLSFFLFLQYPLPFPGPYLFLLSFFPWWKSWTGSYIRSYKILTGSYIGSYTGSYIGSYPGSCLGSCRIL